MNIEKNLGIYKYVKYKLHVFPNLLEILEGIHSKLIDLRNYNSIKIKLLNTIPKISEISIETLNRCNGSCSFCPVNKNLDTRKYHLMEENLFYSIIDQLSEINYKGTVSLFANNEPLLDNRIFKFIEYTRNKVPNSRVQILTNGKLLTEEKFIFLAKNLHIFLIDDYYKNKCKFSDNIQRIYNLHQNEYNNVTISLRKENEIMSSRGGSAKNRHFIPKISSSCIIPWEQLYIDSSGIVRLCCSNPLDATILGNTNTESIKDIWNGEKYNEFRNKIIRGRQNFESCKKCDAIYPADRFEKM